LEGAQGEVNMKDLTKLRVILFAAIAVFIILCCVGYYFAAH
jgi:hypothetical protein